MLEAGEPIAKTAGEQPSAVQTLELCATVELPLPRLVKVTALQTTRRSSAH
jgi:hypothetical protein